MSEICRHLQQNKAVFIHDQHLENNYYDDGNHQSLSSEYDCLKTLQFQW